MKLTPKIESTQTTTLHNAVITLEDLRKAFNIPDNASVFVLVPRGGDYSGTTLDFDRDFEGIKVQWTTVEVK